MTHEPETPEVTPVVFRAFAEGDVVALFPSVPDGSYGQCCSYMHVGQHGSADYGHVVRMTRRAEPGEYADLLRELVSIGYDPRPYPREQPWMHRRRMEGHAAWARA